MVELSEGGDTNFARDTSSHQPPTRNWAQTRISSFSRTAGPGNERERSQRWEDSAEVT